MVPKVLLFYSCLLVIPDYIIGQESSNNKNNRRLDILKSVANHSSWKLLDMDGDAVCGENNSDRIIGGKNAALGEFPWLARLGYKVGGTQVKYMCGGSLLNKNFVVTAAHCMKPTQPFTVKLGEYDASKDIDCSNGICADPAQDIPIKRPIIHENYDTPRYANDIALLELGKDAVYNDWVSPICLPHLGVELNYEGQAEAAGWGIMDMDTLDTPDMLQTLKVPIVENDKCQVFYKKVAILSESQLCAGGVVEHDACGGDSGGPLMQVQMGNDSPQYYLMAVVSFGPKMCGGTPPGVFTDTTSYLKWILDNIQSK